jgi:hypothetical protein
MEELKEKKEGKKRNGRYVYEGGENENREEGIGEDWRRK